jgi:16S rRNA (cytidine1402-2'-O)-methyltransferase
MATLYIVPTPIGNLKDITYRAVEVLQNSHLIAAEDTNNSAKLLNHYNIDTPMVSYHKFNERKRTDMILQKLKSGEDVAVISDAGTPGISDPAAIIIIEAIDAGFRVETLPGATAFVPALVSSGLDCYNFYFAGFIPDKEKLREILLTEIAEYSATLIFYEAPHRITKTLAVLYKYFGNRQVVVARELSKIYETYVRSDLKHLTEHPEDITIKGEFVIIVEGKKDEEITEEKIISMIKANLKTGASKKTAVKETAKQTGENKNKVYELALKLKQ